MKWKKTPPPPPPPPPKKRIKTHTQRMTPADADATGDFGRTHSFEIPGSLKKGMATVKHGMGPEAE